jgi:phosphatidate cytidylyltransferase
LLTKLQLLITVGLIMMTISLLYELFRNKGSAILNLSTTFLGAIYIGLSMGTFLGIRELFGFEFPYWLSRQYLPTGGAYDDLMVKQLTYPWGGWMIIAILATIWMCDTAAYFGGLSMGKHHLFPRVSPKKTWEGAVWGFLAAVGTMMGARALVLPFLELHQAIVMGVVIGSLGQLGDLVESLFKRDAGVKDSSTLIPGHGGAFDRFDSLIFVSPILYLYLDFVVLS